MKKLLPIILLLIIILKSNAQNTYVPDDNFEQALIDLGYDSGTLDDYVTTANINNIAFLNIPYKNIADLTGIEDFISLTTLNCYGNQLTDLDLSTNINLIELRCFDNQLTNLNVFHNNLLTTLLCYQNQLNSIDVSQNTLLEVFIITHNQLTALDVSQNIMLVNFWSGHNPINAIDVNQNTNLEIFYCSDSELTSLDVSQNIGLKELRCGNNLLSSIDISQNNMLEKISCNNNQLTTLDVSYNTELLSIRCEFNQFTELDFSNNPHIGITNPSEGIYFSLFHNYNLTYVNLKNGFLNSLSSGFNNFANLPLLETVCVNDVNSNIVNDITNQVGHPVTFIENCNSLSVDEYSLQEFSIYPNPVINNLNFKSKTTITQIRIFNINGQSFVLKPNGNKIDISRLNKGIYFIKVLDINGGFKIRKFLKN